MPNFHIRGIAAAFAFLLTTAVSHAALLDWNSQNFSGTSKNYNVDGVGGNDITVSYVASSGVQFVSNPSSTTVDGIPSLAFPAQTLVDNAHTVTVTITFTGTYATTGVNASFSLIDVDMFLPQFQDQVSVTAKNSLGAAVTLFGSNNPGALNTVTGNNTTNPMAMGSGNATDSLGNVNISTTDRAVSSITFVWNNPAASSTFGNQTIGLGNITFTAAPEVGSGSAALLLCGGLLAFGRRRQSIGQAAA